jgi:hypothetical protein
MTKLLSSDFVSATVQFHEIAVCLLDAVFDARSFNVENRYGDVGRV